MMTNLSNQAVRSNVFLETTADPVNNVKLDPEKAKAGKAAMANRCRKAADLKHNRRKTRRDTTRPTGKLTDPDMGQMRCAVCGCLWTPLLRSGGRMPRGYRKCPNGCRRAPVRSAMRELAEKVAGKIVKWEPDRSLEWRRDKLHVRVDLDVLLPLDGSSGVKAHRQRNRFVGALAATLSKTNWRKRRTGCTFYWSGRL